MPTEFEPKSKPMRDFLGQEIRLGDFLACVVTAGNLCALALVEVVGVENREYTYIKQFEVKVVKTSSLQTVWATGDIVRLVCPLEVTGEKDVYQPSQTFMKVPSP